MGIGAMILGSIALLGAGYKGMQRSIEDLLPPEPGRITPAVALRDDQDFVPSDRPVVLGHYFMSIAGLSPIISAILGLYWGWLPALIWLIVGVTLLGTVTEYYHIMLSLRNKGQTIGELVVNKIGNATGRYFEIVLIFFGAITFAIMGVTMADTLAKIPTAVIPTLILIPLALCFGLLRRKGWPLVSTAALCLVIWALSIFLGQAYPIKWTKEGWFLVMTIYTFFATYVPVWALLQPRDYLNSFVLVAGLSIAIIALVVGSPAIKLPAWVSWESARGPLFPAIFITVSCGAVNAMHAMMSAGMAARQVSSEKDAYPIVGLGVRGETVMALTAMALIITKFDYTAFTTEVVKAVGPTYSAAFGTALTYIGLPEIVGITFGALTLSAFVMTTMDSYARAARYTLQEFAESSPALKGLTLNKRLTSTVVVTVLAYLLGTYTPFMSLWAGFVAMSLYVLIYSYGLALIDRLESRRPFDTKYWIYVVIPGALMTATIVYTVFYFTYRYYAAQQWIAFTILLGLIVLMVLTFVQIGQKLSKLMASAQAPAQQSTR